MRFLSLSRKALISGSAMRYSSSAAKVPLLLTPKQLKELPKSTTLPLDCSWHMPNSPRSALAEHLSGPRIPGARRFDLDEVAELSIEKNPTGLTHMLPSAERFKEACEDLGISNETHVVLYDTIGVFSSPRGAYTFKALGHDKVSILDGGLPRWIAEGYDTEVGESANHGKSEYTLNSSSTEEHVRSYDQVVANSQDDGAELLLDFRPLGRYLGESSEPRAGLSSGHIPNSLPLPFMSLLEPAVEERPYTSYSSTDKLKEVFVESVGSENWKEIEGGKGVIFSCGSGMTAAVGWLANEVLKEQGGGAPKTSIYDESWTGYASREESKIDKGDPR